MVAQNKKVSIVFEISEKNREKFPIELFFWSYSYRGPDSGLLYTDNYNLHGALQETSIRIDIMYYASLIRLEVMTILSSVMQFAQSRLYRFFKSIIF